MKTLEQVVRLSHEIQSKYVKGVGYETYRKCSPHEIMMEFRGDTYAEAFEAWFKTEGFPLFAKFEAEYEPTYKRQYAVVLAEMKEAQR